MSTTIRDAVADLKASILSLATETKDESRERLVEFANLAELVAVDLVTGKLNAAQAQEAAENLALATRSALVAQGYATQERALGVAQAGVLTALRIIAALA